MGKSILTKCLHFFMSLPLQG